MKNNLRCLIILLPVFLLMAAFSGCGSAKAAKEPVQEESSAGDSEEKIPEEAAQSEKAPATEEELIPLAEDTAAKDDKKDAENIKTEEAVQDKATVWAGKKVSICGDSISTFTGYIPGNYSKFYPENGDIQRVEDTWWYQVVSRTGMKLFRNASYSGSTVSGLSQDDQDGRFACGNKRMADLAGESKEPPDVILVLMGANDLLNDIPLGAYDGVSAVQEGNIETFSEAYALMIDKMKLWYPEAEIYCCTIAEVSRWNDGTGEKFPYKNAHNLTASDYNAWIASIAQAKGVKLIDVYNCGLTYENAKENTSDGTHPNAAGAKLIADKVYESFR